MSGLDKIVADRMQSSSRVRDANDPAKDEDPDGTKKRKKKHRQKTGGTGSVGSGSLTSVSETNTTKDKVSFVRVPINSTSSPAFGPGSSRTGLGASDVESAIFDNYSLKPDNDDKNVDPLARDNICHWRRESAVYYGYFGLFRFCTALDQMYIILGVIAAIIGGICVPMMIYVFGNMVRKVVLVGRIQHAIECKDPDHKILGHQADCAAFLSNCSIIDRPFDQKPLTPQYLLKIIRNSTNEFAMWHSICAAIFMVCSSIYFICWHTAADNQIVRIRRTYFEALLRKDMTWFDTQSDPDSVNKLMDHTRAIIVGIGENIPIAINLITIFIVSIILSICTGWGLTLLGILAVIVLVCTTTLYNWTDSKRMIAELKSYKFANMLAIYVLSNIRTVIFYGGQRKELVRFKKELQRNNTGVIKWIIAKSFCTLFFWVANFIMWALIFWYGMALVIYDHSCRDKTDYNEYDAGDLVIVVLAMMFGAGNIYMVIPVYHAIKGAIMQGRKVFSVIDSKSRIDPMDHEGAQIPELDGDIEFEDVRFTYPNRPDDIVLNHLNMKIPAKSKVAIVGLNGCGKSSILKLISKQYLPDSGFIKIDGVDIRLLNTQWLRSQIGVVPQETNLFNDTIEANIRMGKMDASFFEVQEACKSANAHSFIVAMKEAYQTRIGANGHKLSPGQQQRLSIARALLRKPKILLLDEPTNFLDPESELLVMETLNTIAVDRTVILVTHRLHTVTTVNQIFVIKRGKVSEKGPHSTLIRNKGPYSQLASGLFDKPSNSVRLVTPIKGFDVSDVTALHYMKIFLVKPNAPNIYIDLMSMDPVAMRMGKHFVDDIEVRGSGGDQYKAIRGPDYDDSKYSLQYEDSVKNINDMLTKSEEVFKDRNENEVATKQVDTSPQEVEGLKDILNVKRHSLWKVFWLATNSSYKIFLLTTALSAVVIGLALPVFGVLFGEVIMVLSDATAYPQDWTFATQLGEDNYYDWIVAGFFLIGLIGGTAALIHDFSLNFLIFHMMKFVRKRVFASYLKQDLSFFENHSNSVAAMRDILTNNVMTLRYIITGFYSNLLLCLVAVIFSIILGCTIYDKVLTGYAALICLALTIITFTDGWLAKKQQRTTVDALSEISGLILEVFKGKRNVTVLQMESFFLDRFMEVQLSALRVRRRISYVRAFTFGLSQTAVFWGYSLFIYLGANAMINNNHSFRDVIAIGEMLLFGLISLGMNLSMFPSFKVAINGGEGILNVLHRQPRLTNCTGDDVPECEGKLGYYSAHFWYPYSGDNPLLKGVSFIVEPGQTVAIVGSSESGKSAINDLTMRFYDATSGVIKLDGRNVKELNILSMRQHMGFVDKQAQLFNNRSVAENIAYGDNMHEISMSDIVAVARKTKMHNFFCSLPDGYETRIGSETERLSMAQKRRILIARALLHDPKILFIDEAQAALDREGEKLVNEAVEIARQGRTCMIIAHRLETIQTADMIIMMHDGYIVEKGTHEELRKNPQGHYSKLWRSQNPLEDESFSKGARFLKPPSASKVRVDKADKGAGQSKITTKVDDKNSGLLDIFGSSLGSDKK